MIWDLHCHLNGAAGRTPAERMAHLIAAADRLGIERVCVYMGLSFVQEPSPDDLRRANDEVLEALEHWHDRAFGFAYVSGDHVDASLAEIDRCVDRGPMLGIKLWVARRCSDPAVDPIIRRAADLKAVIFQHTWHKTNGENMPGESTPEDLAELARRFPKVPLICGHTGGTWEWGVRVVRPLENVSIDLAGSDPTCGFVEMAVRELGPDRIIWGSDAGGRSLASQLAKVTGAALDEPTRRKILRDNLRNLLLPIARRKGLTI